MRPPSSAPAFVCFFVCVSLRIGPARIDQMVPRLVCRSAGSLTSSTETCRLCLSIAGNSDREKRPRRTNRAARLWVDAISTWQRLRAHRKKKGPARILRHLRRSDQERPSPRDFHWPSAKLGQSVNKPCSGWIRQRARSDDGVFTLKNLWLIMLFKISSYGGWHWPTRV